MTNKTGFTLNELLKISKALNIPIDCFLGVYTKKELQEISKLKNIPMNYFHAAPNKKKDKEEQAQTEEIQALVEKNTFAILIIQTKDKQVILQPINKDFNLSISYTIKEAKEKYPDAKMKLYEENYFAYSQYF